MFDYVRNVVNDLITRVFPLAFFANRINPNDVNVYYGGEITSTKNDGKNMFIAGGL